MHAAQSEGSITAGASLALSMRSGMSDDAVRLTTQVESMIVERERTSKVAQRVIMNSWAMTDPSYCSWLTDMIRHYPAVSQMVAFDHRAGADYLCSLIQGLDAMRRRIHGMTVDQETSLILGSFVLLKINQRQRQRFFYLGADEIALKDEILVKALISVTPERQQQMVDTLSRLSGSMDTLRAAEVESALSGSQAGVLVEGAL